MSRFHLQCNQLELFVRHIVLLSIISSARTFFFVQLALVSRALESLENQNTGDQGKVRFHYKLPSFARKTSQVFRWAETYLAPKVTNRE